MKATSPGGPLVDPALGWSHTLRVEVGGAGTVAQAGVVLPRLLADRLGLTGDLAEVVARAGFFPLRHRGTLDQRSSTGRPPCASGIHDDVLISGFRGVGARKGAPDLGECGL